MSGQATVQIKLYSLDQGFQDPFIIHILGPNLTHGQSLKNFLALYVQTQSRNEQMKVFGIPLSLSTFQDQMEILREDYDPDGKLCKLVPICWSNNEDIRPENLPQSGQTFRVFLDWMAMHKSVERGTTHQSLIYKFVVHWKLRRDRPGTIAMYSRNADPGEDAEACARGKMLTSIGRPWSSNQQIWARMLLLDDSDEFYFSSQPVTALVRLMMLSQWLRPYDDSSEGERGDFLLQVVQSFLQDWRALREPGSEMIWFMEVDQILRLLTRPWLIAVAPV